MGVYAHTLIMPGLNVVSRARRMLRAQYTCPRKIRLTRETRVNARGLHSKLLITPLSE